MIYLESDLKKYIDYWNNDLKYVLQWFYKDWDYNNKSIRNIILSANHNSFNDIKPRYLLKGIQDTVLDCPSESGKICPDEFFFSASMYYLSVIPQIICKIASPLAARRFLNSIGWPAISLGLGGFMSAEQILYESGLLPFANEVTKYISLIKIIHNFHKKELEDYMSGASNSLSSSEYALFIDDVKTSRKQILNELDRCVASFIKICEKIKETKEHSWQTMYLNNNCAFYD